MKKILSGSIIKNPTNLLMGASTDHIEDRSGYLRSDSPVTWTGTELQFTSNIVLEIVNTVNGTVSQHTILAAGSPVALSNLESAYILIDRTLASENVSIVRSSVTPVPAQTNGNRNVFIIARRVDASGAQYLHIPFHKQVLEPGQTVRLGASGTGSTGSGNGDEVISLAYKASFRDDFDNIPLVTGPVNIGAGFTDSTLYAAAQKYYRLNYDATKTVTGTGTSMTLSGAPTFTIKIGDILRVGSEARRITAVGTQTTPTIEAAFSTNPTAASCTVSQAVYTVDLNGFAGDGLAVGSIFTDNIASLLLTYDDTETLGDIIPDNGATPNIAYSASANSSSYSTVSVRPNGVSNENDSVSLPVVGTNLLLRFFSNKTSGSGAVNFLGYKVFFHREDTQDNGFTLQQALCFTDGVGTEIGCSTPVVVNSKTTVALNFTYTTGLNSGSPNGQLEVFLDGKKIPRFVDSTITPDASYTEIGNNTIALDSDYSAYNFSLEVIKPVAAQDVSEDNADDIFAMETHKFENFQVNGNFDFWQRQVTFNNIAQSTYCADRWVSYNGTTATVNVTRQTISTLRIGSQYCLRSQRSAGNAGWGIASHFEGSVLTRLGGRYVTYSLLLRKGSALTSDLTVDIQTTDTEARDGVAVDSSSLVIPAASLDTTEFRRFSVTLFIPVASVFGGMRVRVTASAQAGGANVYFEATQVMVNEGQTIAPYRWAGSTLSGELLACQRYYAKSYVLGNFVGDANASGAVRWPTIGTSAGDGTTYWKYPATMRIIPTLTFTNPTTGTLGQARGSDGANYAVDSTVPGTTGTAIINTGAVAAFILLNTQIAADSEL